MVPFHFGNMLTVMVLLVLLAGLGVRAEDDVTPDSNTDKSAPEGISQEALDVAKRCDTCHALMLEVQRALKTYLDADITKVPFIWERLAQKLLLPWHRSFFLRPLVMYVWFALERQPSLLLDVVFTMPFRAITGWIREPDSLEDLDADLAEDLSTASHEVEYFMWLHSDLYEMVPRGELDGVDEAGEGKLKRVFLPLKSALDATERNYRWEAQQAALLSRGMATIQTEDHLKSRIGDDKIHEVLLPIRAAVSGGGPDEDSSPPVVLTLADYAALKGEAILAASIRAFERQVHYAPLPISVGDERYINTIPSIASLSSFLCKRAEPTERSMGFDLSSFSFPSMSAYTLPLCVGTLPEGGQSSAGSLGDEEGWALFQTLVPDVSRNSGASVLLDDIQQFARQYFEHRVMEHHLLQS